jgi:N-acetylglucosamine kinase-like BadF-type ATPase
MDEEPMTRVAVLAIDGGNSKTDAALVAADGSVLAMARGPGSSPPTSGFDPSLAVLRTLVEKVCADAAISLDGHPIAERVEAYLAGADLPVDEERLQAAIAARGWGLQTRVRNDTFALLRAGSRDRWGVAVVCGAGINCVGVAPDGTATGFSALGTVSGDWGGGWGLGEQALWWAARAEDGRGPHTALEQTISAHFGRASIAEVTAAFHHREFPGVRLRELVPVIFRCAGMGDPVADRLVARMAEEIVLMATVVLRRLGLVDEPAAIVLGGGVLTAGNRRLLDAVFAGFAHQAPKAVPRLVDVPPIVGAALLGLDELGADPAAEDRLRMQFGAAAAAGAIPER